jgi:hypothetical protein
VGIGLVTDVPDQAVVRSIEHVVERNGELDHPQPRTEMAARDGDGVDGFPTQFVGELTELPRLQAAQVGRRLDEV